MTLISTTTLSGSSVTISSIPGTYKNLQLVIKDLYSANNDEVMRMRINGDTDNVYASTRVSSKSTAVNLDVGATTFTIADGAAGYKNSDNNAIAVLNFYDYASVLDHVVNGVYTYLDFNNVQSVTTISTAYYPSTSAAITSLVLLMSSGNFGGGTALLYGVN